MTMGVRAVFPTPWPCSLPLILDAQAQRRSRKIGENESVTSIFLLFLEGEFIFHILKGVCVTVL